MNPQGQMRAWAYDLIRRATGAEAGWSLEGAISDHESKYYRKKEADDAQELCAEFEALLTQVLTTPASKNPTPNRQYRVLALVTNLHDPTRPDETYEFPYYADVDVIGVLDNQEFLQSALGSCVGYQDEHLLEEQKVYGMWLEQPEDQINKMLYHLIKAIPAPPNAVRAMWKVLREQNELKGD